MKAFAWSSSTFACCFLFCLILYVFNPRYFFIDDGVAMFAPVYYEISQQLQAGRLPLLTKNLLSGGNFLIEYQFGIFNPVCLIGIYVYGLFSDHALGLAVLAGLVAGLTGLSALYCLRAVGLSLPLASLGGVTIGLQTHNIVWNLAAWWPAAFGLLFVIFLTGSLFWFLRVPNLRTGVLLVISSFMLTTGGWPLSIAVAALVVCVAIIAFAIDGPRGVRMTRIACAISALSIGAAWGALSLLPMLTSAEFVSRPLQQWTNNSSFLIPPIKGLAAFFLPFYTDHFHSWGGHRIQMLPHFYITWWLLPAMFLINWRHTGRSWTFWFPMICALLFVLLTQGPETLGPLRFPIRFTPYAQFFFMLAIASAWSLNSISCQPTKARLGAFGLVVLLGAVVGIQNAPQFAERTAVSAAFTFCAGSALLIAYTKHFYRSAYFVLAVGTLSALIWIFSPSPYGLYAVADPMLETTEGRQTTHPHGRGADWGLPSDRKAYDSHGLKGEGGYTLMVGGYSQLNPAAYSEYLPSSTGLLAGIRTLNGYTSLGHTQFKRIVPADDHGHVFDVSTLVSNLFTVDHHTARTYAELLNVKNIVSVDRKLDAALESGVPISWRREKTGHTQVWTAPVSPGRQGNLSHGPSGIKIEPLEIDHTAETYKIESINGERIVFSRLFWPGYTAQLNGLDLMVVPHQGLVSTFIPPDAQGLLTLKYSIPLSGLHILTVAILTIVFAVVFGYCLRKTTV